MSTHQNDFEKSSSDPNLCLGNILDSIPGNVVVIKSNGKIAEVNLGWRNFAIINVLAPDTIWVGQDYMGVFKKLSGISNESASEPSEKVYFQYVKI